MCVDFMSHMIDEHTLNAGLDGANSLTPEECLMLTSE